MCYYFPFSQGLAHTKGLLYGFKKLRFLNSPNFHRSQITINYTLLNTTNRFHNKPLTLLKYSKAKLLIAIHLNHHMKPSRQKNLHSTIPLLLYYHPNSIIEGVKLRFWFRVSKTDLSTSCFTTINQG